MTTLNGTTEIDENLLLFSSNFLKQREYWEKKLSGEITKTSFLSEMKRKETTRETNEKINIIFTAKVSSRLLKISKNSDISIYIILLAALEILLNRYGNNEDIIILSPVYRPNVSEETINDWVMIRSRVKPDMMVKEFILQVRQSVLQAYENQDYPMGKLINDLLPQFSGSGEQGNKWLITNVVSIFKNIHEHHPREKEPGDRFLFVFERTGPEKVQGSIRYNAGIYDDNYTRQAAGHFLKILEGIIFHIDSSIRDISFLSIEERKRLLEDFNGKKSDYSCDKTVHELFRHQAGRVPDHVSVVDRTEGVGTRFIASDSKERNIHITYNQLNNKSEQLAYLLKGKNARPDTIVGIMKERSVEMVVGIFGILKAGAAYLPIDPEYPKDRIDYMLKDSNAEILLKDNAVEPGKSGIRISKSRCFQTNPNEQNPNEQNKASTPIVLNFKHLNFEFVSNFGFRASDLNSSSLAYLLYTSGSTGSPKGVMVGHRSLVHRLNWLQEQYCLNERDVILQKTPYTFDVSVCEMFRWIPGGGRLYLHPPGDEKDPSALAAAIARQNATTADFVPSMLNIFLEYLETNHNQHHASTLRWVFVGVEPLTWKLAEKFKKILHYPYGTRLINAYGLTETTIDNTHFDCTAPGPYKTVPIGKPMANTRIYILDKENRLQPPGAPGEICISGECLAKGYLNNPELTSQKFCLRRPGGLFSRKPPPWTPRKSFSLEGTGRLAPLLERKAPGKRNHTSHIFHSGDLGYRLPDGDICFIGRKDCQVKIRGHRVELGEIQNRLMKIDMIKEALVIDRELPCQENDDTPDRYLCAYVVYNEDAPTSQLQEILSRSLPDYMVPAYVIRIDKIPRRPNGKVNRKLLPEPEIKAGTDYIPPGNHIEKKLIEIWAGILVGNPEHEAQMREIIGVNDSFFRRGGHSLKAAVLMARIHKVFEVKLTLGDIFTYSTVRELAKKIRGQAKNQYKAIKPVEKKEYYMLSSAQKRLYIQQQMKPDNVNYNLPIYLSLEGQWERVRLEGIFQHLIHRHESLRTFFEVVGDEAVQRIHDKVAFKIEYYDLIPDGERHSGDKEGTRGLAPLSLKRDIPPPSLEPATTLISSFIHPFDLSQAPLLRVGFIKEEDKKYILMVDMHHIITDGVSMDIMVKEFVALHGGEEFPCLRLGYKDFTQWQNRWLDSEETKKQEEYWLKQFEDNIPILQMPTDFPRPDIRSFRGEVTAFKIDGELDIRLRKLASEAGTTLFNVLMAVCYTLIFKYSGQEDIVLGTAAVGRDHADSQDIIGIFVNLLAMRNKPLKHKRFLEFLSEVKENTLNAYRNQDYQFEELVRKLNLQGAPGRNPLFDVAFNFFKPEISQIKKPGLTLKPYGYNGLTCRFDLVIWANDNNDAMEMGITYSTELFKKSTAEKMAEHYLLLLEQALENSEIKLEQIKIPTKYSEARSAMQKEDIRFRF